MDSILPDTRQPNNTTQGSVPDEQSVKKLFRSGSAWALVNYGLSTTLRLGSNLVLWRLLNPEAFGLMAIVNVFLVGLSMFSDIGIGQAIVQNERGDDPVFLNTVWTIQVVRGTAVTILACLIAIPVSRFYHQPLLAGLIPVVSLGTGIGAFNSTNLFTASRRVALGRLTVVDTTSQALSLAVMIVWSYVTHSVWALAAGSVTTGVIRLYLTHAVLPGIRNRFCWDRDTVRTLTHFGRWIFFSTILSFLVSNSDRLIFGKLVSIQMLGAYSISAVWATFPTYIAGHMINSVLFPLFSRLGGHGGGIALTIRKWRALLLVATGWLCACLLAGGPLLIRFLYDKRALEAGYVLQLLAIGTWFSVLENMNSAVLLALGKPKWIAVGNGAKLICMFLFMFLGGWLFGVPGAVLGLSLSEVGRYVVSASATARNKVANLGMDFGLTAIIAATAVIGLVARRGYDHIRPSIQSGRLEAFVEGAAIFALLTILWLAVLVFLRRRYASAPVSP